MELPHHHPSQRRSRPAAMVQPRPLRDRRRRTLPGLHPSYQSRPVSERHPKETYPLPLRVGPGLSDSRRAPGGRCETRPTPPPQAPLALYRERKGRRARGAGGPRRASPHRSVGLPPAVGARHRLDLVFDTTLPSGKRMRYQVLRIAVPRKGRALPLVRLAYDRDALPANKSQNQLEQDTLWAVVRALPLGVRPVVLADRGFRRAGFLCWLQRYGLDYVVRLSKGSCITEADGKQRKLGEERLRCGELRWLEGVRYGLYHGRPRELFTNIALCWRVPKSRARNPRRKQPEEPWYLATSLKDAQVSASWYWRPGGIEQSF